MRVVVIGATGNVGTSVVDALSAERQVSSIVGVARRLPQRTVSKTEWVKADITESDLVPVLRDADAVVHLAWAFQPTRDPAKTWQTNVLGSARVLQAVAGSGVPALIYASSVGAYSPGPKDRPVDESWPTHGWPTAAYGREKAYVERLLDGFQAQNPLCRVVRLRPGFIFKPEAAVEQRRLFAGPLVPGRLARPGLIPFVPDIPGLRFQVLHATDAAQAYLLATMRDVHGPFNIAAGPVVDVAVLADLLHARTIRVPAAGARGLLSVAWKLGMVPASPQLFDLLMRVPIMSTARAQTELGWSPAYSSGEAIAALFEGLRAGTGAPTPPLSPAPSGPLRIREFVSALRHSE
jgi:nucleoside-diphosphate-sugar epimerase